MPSSSSAAAAVPAAGGGYSPSSSSVSRMSSLIWKISVYAPRLWLMVCRNCIFTVRWVRRRWDAVARCLSIRFSVRLSVCPSVTRRYFIKTVKYILKHLSHQRVATPFYFFQTKQYGNIPTRIPHGGSNSGGVKNRDFRPISRFNSETIQDRESHSYYGRRIGNRTKAFEWYQF